jgi:hypothetical protein
MSTGRAESRPPRLAKPAFEQLRSSDEPATRRRGGIRTRVREEAGAKNTKEK